MSDSLGLSDKRVSIVCLVVRFFTIIGQASQYRLPGCPILWDYRTSGSVSSVWLSDSSGLSDKRVNIVAWLSDTLGLSDKRVSIFCLTVRFFGLIGQHPKE
jgi:hypothetical protein